MLNYYLLSKEKSFFCWYGQSVMKPCLNEFVIHKKFYSLGYHPTLTSCKMK